MKSNICKQCNTEFPASSFYRMFCGSPCRKAYNAANPEIKNCKQCNVEFPAVATGQKFCSEPCRTVAYTSITKTCLFCQRDYRTGKKDQIYCSNVCRGKAHQTGQLVNCQSCDRLIKVTPSKLSRTKFCSTACHDLSRRHDRVERVEAKCPQCRKIFLTTVADAQKFCSTPCRDRFYSVPRVPTKCPTCLKTFIVAAYRRKRDHSVQVFCSRSCSTIKTLRTMTKHGTSIEKAIDDLLSKLTIIYLPQFKIGRWVCDFYVPLTNLVIECDGTYWHSLPKAIERDKRKDAWLKKHGYNLLRLTETEINNSPVTCLEKIKQAIYG